MRRHRSERAADPAKRKYIPLVEWGEQWSGEQTAYYEDRNLTATCAHLQPIERAMRLAGIEIRHMAKLVVYVNCPASMPPSSSSAFP